jgi:hypothetical protein
MNKEYKMAQILRWITVVLTTAIIYSWHLGESLRTSIKVGSSSPFVHAKGKLARSPASVLILVSIFVKRSTCVNKAKVVRNSSAFLYCSSTEAFKLNRLPWIEHEKMRFCV